MKPCFLPLASAFSSHPVVPTQCTHSWPGPGDCGYTPTVVSLKSLLCVSYNRGTVPSTFRPDLGLAHLRSKTNIIDPIRPIRVSSQSWVEQPPLSTL